MSPKRRVENKSSVITMVDEKTTTERTTERTTDGAVAERTTSYRQAVPAARGGVGASSSGGSSDGGHASGTGIATVPGTADTRSPFTRASPLSKASLSSEAHLTCLCVEAPAMFTAHNCHSPVKNTRTVQAIELWCPTAS